MSQSFEPPNCSLQQSSGSERRANRREANRARHRLLSITHDVEALSRIVEQLRQGLPQEDHCCTGSDNTHTNVQHVTESLDRNRTIMCSWPLVSNQRCGPWYGQLAKTHDTPCYFKSTDGHYGTWNFSLQRLNLSFLEVAAKHGGSFVVDASRSKAMPDSFSRTIPIWAAVLNRTYLKFRKSTLEIPIEETDDDAISAWADITSNSDLLFTPHSCITEKEHNLILERIETLVEDLLTHGAIDPAWLLRTLKRPLRPYWITRSIDKHSMDATALLSNMEPDKYTCLVCISCSSPLFKRTQTIWKEETENNERGFWYTPGAADDEESFSKGLTPLLFWSNRAEILDNTHDADETEKAIDNVVQKYVHGNEMHDMGTCPTDNCLPPATRSHSQYTLLQDDPTTTATFSVIGASGISIGSRRSGRPPFCWLHFDAVVNVTDMQYSEFETRKDVPPGKYYLHMPVKEGKRDKKELEKWLPIALVFILFHLASDRRVIIHCAQGADRSVAVAMAAVGLFCNSRTMSGDNSGKHLDLLPWCKGITSLSSLEKMVVGNENTTKDAHTYGLSGIDSNLAETLTGRRGRELFFSWLQRCSEQFPESAVNPPAVRIEICSVQNTVETHLVTKQTLRLVLNLIQRYRDKANPSRKTMQKLNRFFISGEYDLESA